MPFFSSFSSSSPSIAQGKYHNPSPKIHALHITCSCFKWWSKFYRPVPSTIVRTTTYCLLSDLSTKQQQTLVSPPRKKKEYALIEYLFFGCSIRYFFSSYTMIDYHYVQYEIKIWIEHYPLAGCLFAAIVLQSWSLRSGKANVFNNHDMESIWSDLIWSES